MLQIHVAFFADGQLLAVPQNCLIPVNAVNVKAVDQIAFMNAPERIWKAFFIVGQKAPHLKGFRFGMYNGPLGGGFQVKNVRGKQIPVILIRIPESNFVYI